MDIDSVVKTDDEKALLKFLQMAVEMNYIIAQALTVYCPGSEVDKIIHFAMQDAIEALDLSPEERELMDNMAVTLLKGLSGD